VQGTALRTLSRRALLKQAAALAALAPVSKLGGTHIARSLQRPYPTLPPPGQKVFSAADEAFLESIERANFLFFWEQTNPQTGMVKDRFNVRGSDNRLLSSIAATGFGLTALSIGHHRGYVSYNEALERALVTLRFIWKKLPTAHGFFYHWANVNTGERMFQSEVSSIDTAILLCGVLTCRQHFIHSEVSLLAEKIFNRVDWQWLSEDTLILPHGWAPEIGFLRYRWDSYSELMMLYLMAMGSSTHPLKPATWGAWKRTMFEFDGIKYIGSFAPIFVHQYSQAWFDFRGKRDQFADYFENSILATEAHRRFCLGLAKQFPDYGEDLWGITASDSVKGYTVWGGPPATGPIDGTIVPCAVAGSLPFLPRAAMRVLRTIQFRYGAGTWSRYGFVDAFNPEINWYDSDVIGIDTGITMVMAENARTGFVWNTFMKNPEAQRGMELAGFKSYEPPEEYGKSFFPSTVPAPPGPAVPVPQRTSINVRP
jgi:hypothetical protein